jgi:hypothetical protein
LVLCRCSSPAVPLWPATSPRRNGERCWGWPSPPPLGILLTGFYPAQRKQPRPRKPKHIIPAELRGVYAEVVAKAVELRDRGLTHPEVCEELNRQGFRTRTGKPWRHLQELIKLLRSFSSNR